eukprot:2091702-Pleurochrysis_carterae.AAC.2
MKTAEAKLILHISPNSEVDVCCVAGKSEGLGYERDDVPEGRSCGDDGQAWRPHGCDLGASRRLRTHL